MTAKKDQAIKGAVIGAVALVIATILGAILQPGWWRAESSPEAKAGFLSVAGTVVDAATNRAIGQARLSTVGRPETSVSEDNGNFRIEVRSDIPKDGLVRLHVVKDGYLPSDVTTMQTNTLIIQLRKQ